MGFERRGGEMAKGGVMAKSVREAMTASVSSVSPSQSLADAAEVMKRKDLGSVPVVSPQS